ncbi:MAG: sodium:alanine symporter family protein, partial [Planctomycetes bacterium]|nr:sodium:alanine symporter family protein [Planctomycetota bacterium]
MGGNSNVLDITEANLVSNAALASAMLEAQAQGEEAGIMANSAKITLSTKGDNPTLTVYKSGIPLAVLWLVLGAIFFTVRMGFIQLRALKHSVAITRGKYDNPDDVGEVSHFQALATALSGTVGLGNIAGVAVAVG